MRWPHLEGEIGLCYPHICHEVMPPFREDSSAGRHAASLVTSIVREKIYAEKPC